MTTPGLLGRKRVLPAFSFSTRRVISSTSRSGAWFAKLVTRGRSNDSPSLADSGRARGDPERHHGDRGGGTDGADARVDRTPAPDRHHERTRQRLRRGGAKLGRDGCHLDREMAAGGAPLQVRVEQLPLELGELAVRRERRPCSGAFAQDSGRDVPPWSF